MVVQREIISGQVEIMMQCEKSKVEGPDRLEFDPTCPGVRKIETPL